MARRTALIANGDTRPEHVRVNTGRRPGATPPAGRRRTVAGSEAALDTLRVNTLAVATTSRWRPT